MNAKSHKNIALIILAATAVVTIIVTMVIWAGDGGAAQIFTGRRISVIRVEGVIVDGSWHVKTLRDCLKDNNVVGVLLRIDSPGGAVAPSQELYNVVADYKKANKPLVVSMGNTAASGGYYIAAPAHTIYASPGTLTGSIGVIFTLPIYEDLAKKIGIDFRVLKAGELKDMGSPYRPMSDREETFLQGLLDDTHEQFIQDVATGRGISVDSVRALADGRIFTGRQALDHGLVDALGGYEDALAFLQEICKLSAKTKPIELRPLQGGLRELLMESAQKHVPGFGTLSRPAGLYYLFVP